jgi:hypothetical protein
MEIYKNTTILKVLEQYDRTQEKKVTRLALETIGVAEMEGAPEARIDGEAGDVFGVLIDIELVAVNKRVEDPNIWEFVEEVITESLEVEAPEVEVSLTAYEA